ncbi:MAG: translation initiation factor IF-2 [Verrucomicrobia bacterium]|nr:translation initiation factor IF-2 [Verrucomicrobiota bacterium]
MRVHELAKELGISSKELMARLHGVNVEVRNQLAALTPEQVALARKAVGGEAAPPTGLPAIKPKAKKAAVKPAPAPPPPEPVAPAAPPAPPEPPPPRLIIVKGPIIVKEFAEQLGLKPNLLIAELMTINVFASINERIEFKVAQQLASRHGALIEHEKKAPEPKPVKKAEPKLEEARPEDFQSRPPVVTFLGHVDHGKTSLLDRIRHSKVVQSEDGGITQHIGAYTVAYRDHPITFLDTPGHAAFTAMRARGANLTDIAVLVVAADDGVMPQTREALQHARAANVSIMVAINKIDLKSAVVDRVKRQLQQEGLAPEDWGGETICCAVSAVTGDGLDHLLEMILLQSEMLELKSNVRRPAQGFVIEARLEAGSGPTANLLVKQGTLTVGDAIVCGRCWGKVKALINDQGIKVRTAGPSIPVKCLGLNGVPEPGMEFLVYPNDREARAIAEERDAASRLQAISTPRRASLDDLLKPAELHQRWELVIVLKTDVQGSLEAIRQALLGIKSDKVSLKIALAGVGNVTGNDVLLASASKAIIVGFHVSKEDGIGALAKREGVEIRLYSVIYQLLDEVRDAMAGLLEPVLKEQVIGHAEVRQIFEIGKKGNVAGCMVVDGRITSRARARVKRADDVLYEGTLASLKRFQDDASEVREGLECGIRLDRFNDCQPGDVIECYEVQKIEQPL